MNKVLTVEDLTVRYGAARAVDRATFSVGAGEFLCVMGANGSGKSTLLRGILGLVPTEGYVLRTPHTGYVPQREGIEPGFPATVQEVVLTGTQGAWPQGLGWRFPFYRREDREAAQEAMSALGISDLAGRRIGALSGGQIRRALLARALCGRPTLLLLDEPCAGLDGAAHQALHEFLGRLRRERGTAVVMVTHDLEDAKALADRVVVMEAGRLEVRP